MLGRLVDRGGTGRMVGQVGLPNLRPAFAVPEPMSGVFCGAAVSDQTNDRRAVRAVAQGAGEPRCRRRRR